MHYEVYNVEFLSLTHMDYGLWVRGCGLCRIMYNLNFERFFHVLCIMVYGLWRMGYGVCNLPYGLCNLDFVPRPAIWVMDNGLCNVMCHLDFKGYPNRLRIMGCGLGAMLYMLCVLGCVRWIMG